MKRDLADPRPNSENHSEASSNGVEVSSSPEKDLMWPQPILHSRSTPFILRPEPILKQLDAISKPVGKETKELHSTCEHTNNLLQAVLFEQLNEGNFDNMDKSGSVQNEMNLRQNRKTRKSRPDVRSNLKTVANHIHSVLINNPGISVKVLSYIIYEIIIGTDYGHYMIDENFPTVRQHSIDTLEHKYKEQNIGNGKGFFDFFVKNTKRRIYDAVNVMLAADIMIKGRDGRLKLLQSARLQSGPVSLKKREKRTKVKKEESIKDEKQEYSIQDDLFESWLKIEDAKKRIEAKRVQLINLRDKTMTISRFLQRNKFLKEQANYPSPNAKFNLPFLIVKSPGKMILELERNKLTLTSDHKFFTLDDMDCIKQISWDQHGGPNTAIPISKERRGVK